MHIYYAKATLEAPHRKIAAKGYRSMYFSDRQPKGKFINVTDVVYLTASTLIG